MKTFKQIIGVAAVAAIVAVGLRAEVLVSPKQSGNQPTAVSSQKDAEMGHCGMAEAAKQKATCHADAAASTEKAGTAMACAKHTGQMSHDMAAMGGCCSHMQH